MKRIYKSLSILKSTLIIVLFISVSQFVSAAQITGELKMWHRVTLTFDGPNTSETANPNPFTNYRLNVSFTQGNSSYMVPGFFAADGDAANTGATSGNKWRVHFSPPSTGEWNYTVSFRSGTNIHAESSPTAGVSANFIDGETGSFSVGPTDKTGRDMRSKGWLEYVGERYLKFKGNGEYFLKQGTDSPENLFAYKDFDGDFKTDGKKDSNIKTYTAHLADWKTGDPTWAGGKGKSLIGAINYMASEGLNSFSFLTMNINGDDQNVFPYINYTTYDRIDVSRMDQWEIVLEHGTKMGFFLHFKMGETENQTLLDQGETGINRKLYYRELIARFGHHPALNWNLGEENGTWSNFTVPNGSAQSTVQRKTMAQYVYDNDPYEHHIVLHNGQTADDLYGSGSKYTGWSMQQGGEDFSGVHSKVVDILQKAKNAGKIWAVAADEIGGAQAGIRPDNNMGQSHDNGRKGGVWGALMAGAWGCEFYFGYQYDHSDLSCQDFRSRASWWKYPRYALEFFKNNNIPLWEMDNNNNLTDNANDYVLAKPGSMYVIYLKTGGTTDLDVGTKAVNLDIKWYNPRTGGALQDGTKKTISGSGKQNIGQAPSTTTDDWTVIVGYNNLNPVLNSSSIIDSEIKIYPNPVSSMLSISFPNAEICRDVKVFNLSGQLVYSTKTQNTFVQFDVKSLNLKGLILVQIESDKMVSNHKIIVQ